MVWRRLACLRNKFGVIIGVIVKIGCNFRRQMALNKRLDN